MKNATPKPRIVIELDPEHMQALDRARRNVGLNRSSFARATIVRHVLGNQAVTTAKGRCRPMTAGISISFHNQITGFAKANGIDLTREGVESLDAVLRSTLRTDGNRASFVIGADKTGTLEDALTIHCEGAPRKAKASSSSAGNTATARAVAQNSANTPQVRAAEIVRDHGNPWSPRTISRTRQAVLVNLDPSLATRLQKEAA